MCIDNCYSDCYSIQSGVPQDSVLGPLLFNIYTSDLLQITSKPIYGYADDVTLVATVDSPKSRFDVSTSLNEDLKRISLLSKLPSYGFYPSLCTFISSFLSGRSISAAGDGYCSKPKSINSGVLQGSVLSPTLFLLFINDLSITDCPIHSALFHTFKSPPSQIGLHNAQLDAGERKSKETGDH